VEVYKWRHLVENYFAKIKEFRGIATKVRQDRLQPYSVLEPRGSTHSFKMIVHRP
jgi:hypothetical protein